MRREDSISFDSLPKEVCRLRENQEKMFVKIYEMSEHLLKGANNVNPHLTKEETAKFFKVSIGCITDWTNEGVLTKFKVKNRTYYDRAECLRVIFSNPQKVA